MIFINIQRRGIRTPTYSFTVNREISVIRIIFDQVYTEMFIMQPLHHTLITPAGNRTLNYSFEDYYFSIKLQAM